MCGIVLCVTWKCCRDLSTSEEPQEQGALTGPAQPFDTEVTLGARVNQWPAEGLLAGECLRARPSCVRQAPGGRQSPCQPDHHLSDRLQPQHH